MLGTGTFLSASCKLLKDKNFSNEDIINSLYAFDINKDALTFAKLIISAELKLNEKLTKILLKIKIFKILTVC